MNLIPFLVSVTAFTLYQRRLFRTVRQVVVDKTGDKMRVSKYGIFGSQLFSTTTIVPLHIMVGVRKSNLNKGIVMRGGGRFGIKKFDFYFHEAGVLDKEVFDNVIAGKSIKYVDDLL